MSRELSKDEMLKLTQLLEEPSFFKEDLSYEMEKRFRNNTRDKKKKIDEMQKYLGFSILDYTTEASDNNHYIRYKISLDMAAMLSSYLFFDNPYNDVMKKIKKYKALDESGESMLKELVKERFLYMASQSDESISEVEIEKIVNNQIDKLRIYQNTVKAYIAKKDEIREEFNKAAYEELHLAKYYNPDLTIEEAEEMFNAKLAEIEKLKEEIIQKIRDFENTDE